ncbi:MAG: ComF family protein [Bacteroidetes bacterium]|nr:MAG: ComF family protein [Bacteroidota bacterium]
MNATPWLNGIVHLFFPRTCQACGHVLYHQEEVICTKCLYHLPKTNFHFHESNPVSRTFWGRVELNAATSYLFFNKQGKTQRLMHNLKYRGKKQVGLYLGEKFGKELLKSDLFKTVQVIIPVPMHPKKQQKRGYNQSTLIAEGMALAMNAEVQIDNLIKVLNTTSQTKKSRYKRWENVKNVFQVRNEALLKNKHLLIVDDVITTGATIEACAHRLERIEGVTISVASLAYAQV